MLTNRQSPSVQHWELNINDFLNYPPEKELEVTIFLRDIVLQIMPQAKEKLS